MKKEKGSITIITLVTILFMLSFLISSFAIIANRRQAQAEIKKETREIYEGKVENVEDIYQSYFAKTNEAIPIYTEEQLFKIGTNQKVMINEKIYELLPTAKYVLMNNISFKTAEHSGKMPIEETTFTGTMDYNGHVITETDINGNKTEHKQ